MGCLLVTVLRTNTDHLSVLISARPTAPLKLPSSLSLSLSAVPPSFPTGEGVVPKPAHEAEEGPNQGHGQALGLVLRVSGHLQHPAPAGAGPPSLRAGAASAQRAAKRRSPSPRQRLPAGQPRLLLVLSANRFLFFSPSTTTPLSLSSPPSFFSFFLSAADFLVVWGAAGLSTFAEVLTDHCAAAQGNGVTYPSVRRARVGSCPPPRHTSKAPRTLSTKHHR